MRLKYLGFSALLLSTTAHAQDFAPKPASAATIAAQAEIAKRLPADDGSDERFADQGFVATRKDPIIKDEAGKPVWNLDAYAWMKGSAPPSVNPSLWRHQKLLAKHGLYKVSENVWQVRGFDVSNMTVVKGQTGWILIDPLTTKETAAAGLALVNETLGARPVSAVLYSHSHGDHYGGVRGVASEDDIKAGKTRIIAPEHFIEETSSESVMAGAAMGRRAGYQFGGGLKPGAQGSIGSGIGSGIPGGSITLLPPTDLVRKTGDVLQVDGIAFEFQMVPHTEAPAEFNVMIPSEKVLLVAEQTTCSLHNILTPRGAKVRDAHRWAFYLTEAINLYADKAETLVSSHCWPRFGKPVVRDFLTAHRDNYKFLHDQTVRRMNKGETQVELAEGLAPPPGLANQWSTRGYYGTYNHNAKGIYQFYLGWYDAVPAHLNAHPPVERGKRMVAAMGGPAKVIATAKAAMAKGDYRWSSDILNMLVFADPTNKAGRALLADSYEQQGYQAESAIWRNQFLSAARDLREGVKASVATQSRDVVSSIPTGLLLDSVATRIDPVVAGDKKVTINFNITDRKETAKIGLSNSVMISEMGVSHAAPQASISGPRIMFLGLLFQKLPLAQLEAVGLKVEGDRSAVEALLAAIEPMGGAFNIVEP
jgi:alkyl sulfatase BDS1-like metallo-beta-lactamase superfamily hydrolase